MDRWLSWLPFDWRLLAPFFLLGVAVGVGAFVWLLVFVVGRLV